MASAISRMFRTRHLILAFFVALAGCDHTASFLRTSSEPPPKSADAPTPKSADAPTPESTGEEASEKAPAPMENDSLPPPKPEDSTNSDAPLFAPPEPFSAKPLPPGSVAADPVSSVWGIVDFRGYPYGQTIGSNGQEYHQLFSLNLNFNIWLWRSKRLYAYSDTAFWGQKAAPGITNPTQGAFDFSKREFDFTGGVAWNYYSNWELRAFAYSFNNLNRGDSLTSPQGFNDGVGLENRYYLNPTYADLGTPAFDKARATFLSFGYYPSKSMIDGKGVEFHPGAFLRAYLIYELYGPKCYLYTDDTFLTNNSLRPALFTTDTGIAYRPFDRLPRLEFRLGSQDTIDLLNTDAETSAYLALRWIF